MTYDLLKENISKNLLLTKEELDQFSEGFHSRKICKKEYLLKQGEVFKYEGFVVEGCFRVFSIDAKGNENTLYFAASDWWVMDIDSFLNQTPSKLNIQALEDSTVLLINRSKKTELYEKLPVVEKLFRVMSQKALVAWQRRLINSNSLTAKERYSNFLSTYPTICSKISDRHIASYLGITHEFLSKLKKQLVK